MGEVLVATAGGKSGARYGWSESTADVNFGSTQKNYMTQTSGTITAYLATNYDRYGELISPETVQLTVDNIVALTAGKYFKIPSLGEDKIYSNVTSAQTNMMGWIFYSDFFTVTVTLTLKGCVVDDDSSAYPADGYQDGYKYVKVVS